DARSFGMALNDPRQAQAFRFVRASYTDGVAELVYAFDDSPELVERDTFPDAPTLPPGRADAFAATLKWLHLVAGVSYYKAGVPSRIEVDDGAPDAATAELLDTLYLHGLAEFAYRNKLDLADRLHFPRRQTLMVETESPAPALDLPRRTLI